MDLQEFLRKPSFIRFTLWLARVLPRRLAYGLVRFGVNQVVKRKPAVYHIVRNNLAHFPNMKGNEEELDALTWQSFFNGGRYYYDHYRLLSQPIEKIKHAVDIPQEYLDNITEAVNRGQGVVLMGTHAGNFDLGAMVVATLSEGFTIQLLSLAAPPEGFKLMNELRTSVGFEVTPITPQSLRQGISRLKKGGVVGTALDWPHPEEALRLEVFGKPAYVPLGGTRLALMTGARLMIASFYQDPEERYKIHNIPPVDLVRTGDRENDIVTNTRKLIEIFEELIAQYPDQWMMYRPFWAPEDEEGAHGSD